MTRDMQFICVILASLVMIIIVTHLLQNLFHFQMFIK